MRETDMQDDRFLVGPDGLLRRESGAVATEFADGVVCGILEYEEGSFIVLRLFERGTAASGEYVNAADAHQLVLSEDSARQLARLLIDRADELHGVGHPRH
ncbi:hypothetical protein [Pseudoroseicyclus sp. CXY001]|uniref:hypothetical protein n=1 Tax=Pseudoroseicyclus sp. CXY001 TaxID=3242492 RepID=UPI003570E391